MKYWPQLMYRLSVLGTTAKVVDTIKLDRLRGTQEFGGSWIQPNRNIVIFARNNVRIWKYPSGGREVAKLHSGTRGENLYTATVAASASAR